METFYLGHTVLYAKNHYLSSENILKDLTATMDADGYMTFNSYDISRILLNLYIRLPYPGHCQITNLVEGINPHNLWKVGYYTKENTPAYIGSREEREKLPVYDYNMGVIMFVLSYLKFIELKDFKGGLPKANKNVLPLKEEENARKNISKNIPAEQG